MDDQQQIEVLIEALERIVAIAGDEEPADDYDGDGSAPAWWEAADIAREALTAVKGGE